MAIYEIRVSQHNQKPHLDIEEQVQKIKNGLFTFVVRIFDGKIVDVMFLSYESYKSFKDIEELSLSRND